jgi:hypothetical protein
MSNDPTFRVIAEHRRIFKAWQKASCPENGSMYELYFNASNQLFRTAPTTTKGVLALLNYVIGKHDCSGHWGAIGVEFPRPLLRSIREATKRAATGLPYGTLEGHAPMAH